MYPFSANNDNAASNIFSKEEAEAYLAEMADIELDEAMLDKVAGGVCWDNCPKEANCSLHVCGTVGWGNLKGR